MESCALVLAKNFKHWGTNHIFGIPGKAISPIIFATDAYDIEFVLSKHETGAGFSAAGYSLMSEKFGVAIGTSGPGGTNLLTAAGQAKASNIPMLIITGHPGTKDSGKAMGQDSSIFGTDLVEMFKPVTKFSARVERADLLQRYLQHALEKAFTGVKGPVHLSIAFDILIEEIEPFVVELPTPIEMISPSLHEVVDMLNVAKRPLLYLGKGVHSSRAYEEVRRLAENWNIPVMTTPGGKGTFKSNHKLSLGAFGLGGTIESAEYLQQGVDLMIVIGTKLSDMSIAGFTKDFYPKHVIHFDYEQTFIGKTIEVPTTAIIGDIRSNLSFIVRNLREKVELEFILPRKVHQFDMNEPNERMTSETTLKVIRNTLPDDAIIFGDDGSHTFYGIKYFDIYEPGSFFFDDIFGAMGHGIGYSIGAKLAAPDKNIVCLVGDGCMFMHGTEISTALNYHSPVLFLVLNNGRLDMVEKGMRKMIGKSIGAVYETPLNAALFAQSMGLSSFRCYNPEQLQEAIQEAYVIMKEMNQPVVVEIMVDENEIPPTMGRQ
ncbi:acetolactate synthase-1/2/3 large subunit [Bacillus mesophilus]|uniref:Thiamine pyrophosphate-binding protein n=1 Tax=Bacillus mesophilus TaxID=1808955 RepID=A0A6M0QA68_9BACI|nr:thiamine pyrophosphate-binding protein [Bacillus mesophilus]MBM7662706.1 acetolactate synthase-1/2/3 large subunit [Bacillus mesophilus]NEY73232.1 thiamine pyrophosphate-binding protein [Bacillus mesophilus]